MKTDAPFWDKIAAKYAEDPIRDEAAYRQALARTCSYLKPDDRVLELGCGTGSTAIELASQVAEITVSDLSQGMLAIARDRAAAAGVGNIHFHQGSVAQAPEGTFDVVLAHNLLHLLPDLQAALALVSARLPKGALFISKTPCLGETRGSAKYWLFKAMIPVMRFLGKAPTSPVHFFDITSLEAVIKAAGFELVETGNYPVSTPGRYIVARRL
ncbi:class I SAM-dependent methyltransferase [Pseudophaeobacter sp.]|uniref:class I SAM-dependent methyltransferase n=1 Tax=Pseudophaeobacter sp. TaxID=1971739 RepID=UPI003A970542